MEEEVAMNAEDSLRSLIIGYISAVNFYRK
jgi:hypothetical protein